MAGVSRIISTLLGVIGSASAQYRIDAWTTEDGLPQNVVTDITQTRDGFLWRSTFDGLVRFDGAKMHVFTTINAPVLVPGLLAIERFVNACGESALQRARNLF